MSCTPRGLHEWHINTTYGCKGRLLRSRIERLLLGPFGQCLLRWPRQNSKRHLVHGPFLNYSRLVCPCHLCQPQIGTPLPILPLNQGCRRASFFAEVVLLMVAVPEIETYPIERRAQPEITLGTLLLVELGQDDGRTRQETVFVCPVAFRVSF